MILKVFYSIHKIECLLLTDASLTFNMRLLAFRTDQTAVERACQSKCKIHLKEAGWSKIGQYIHRQTYSH